MDLGWGLRIKNFSKSPQGSIITSGGCYLLCLVTTRQLRIKIWESNLSSVLKTSQLSKFLLIFHPFFSSETPVTCIIELMHSLGLLMLVRTYMCMFFSPPSWLNFSEQSSDLLISLHRCIEFIPYNEFLRFLFPFACPNFSWDVFAL